MNNMQEPMLLSAEPVVVFSGGMYCGWFSGIPQDRLFVACIKRSDTMELLKAFQDELYEYVMSCGYNPMVNSILV